MDEPSELRDSMWGEDTTKDGNPAYNMKTPIGMLMTKLSAANLALVGRAESGLNRDRGPPLPPPSPPSPTEEKKPGSFFGRKYAFKEEVEESAAPISSNNNHFNRDPTFSSKVS